MLYIYNQMKAQRSLYSCSVFFFFFFFFFFKQKTAYEIARTGRPGPVVVDIPKDVQNWEGVFLGEGLLPILGYRRRMRELAEASLDAAAAERFFAMLGESRRPLIYAGGGVINGNAAGALAEFTTAFNVPVVTTLMGIGALDT